MTTPKEYPPPANELRYCPYCAAPLSLRLLPSEERPRLACERDHIFYVNPKVVVNIVAERGGRLLLMRRAIEPRQGAWTMPGGFMEIDESLEECAVREAHEETGLTVRPLGIVGLYSKPTPPGPGIVSIVYRGRVTEGRAAPGREALEVRWFRPQNIPWDELAYDTTRWALRDWLRSRQRR